MRRSTFRRSRLPIVFVAAGAVLLAACGSSGSSTSSSGGGGSSTSTTAGEYGTLPAQAGSPSGHGTITFPIENGSQANYIFPITPTANSSIYNVENLQYLLWRP